MTQAEPSGATVIRLALLPTETVSATVQMPAFRTRRWTELVAGLATQAVPSAPMAMSSGEPPTFAWVAVDGPA